MTLKSSIPAKRHTSIVAIFALLFWLYFFVEKNVIGALNEDEIYFAHTMWLIDHGYRQYVDFYNSHLPTYFAVLAPLVRSLGTSSSDLTFVAAMRLISLPVAAAYAGLLFAVHRRAPEGPGRAGLLAAMALLFLFIGLGRMIEVRTDTLGILALNAAWAILLLDTKRSNILWASVLALLAALFSARALPMLAGFGCLLLYLVLRRRDHVTFFALVLIGIGAIAALLATYLLFPQWSILVFNSVFLDPVTVMPKVSLEVRVFGNDRVILTAFIAAGLISSMMMLKADHDRGAVILAATVTQLGLILLDPSPFLYVYGWAALPTVIGLVRLFPSWSAYAALGTVALYLVPAMAYRIVEGQQPPSGSHQRLVPDPLLAKSYVARLDTPQLVQMLITGERQENIVNQLRLRSELCGRIRGKVSAGFGANPICLPDAAYRWTPADVFQPVFEGRPPHLIIWGRRFTATPPLEPKLRQELECCYTIHDGFAILRTSANPPDATAK